MMVEPPLHAIGENAPAQLPECTIVDAAQIAQHLRGRGPLLLLALLALPVERPLPALRLHDAQSVLEAFPRRERGGRRLGLLVFIEQRVRHILAVLDGGIGLDVPLLPAQAFQQGIDQLVFGLRLVG
jgi:hypothetical protein